MKIDFDSGCKTILVITILFSLPMLLNGIYYQDDIIRSLTGDTLTYDATWEGRGRPLSSFVMHFLSFGYDRFVNIFPISYVISVLFLSLSSITLYSVFSEKKGIQSGLIFSIFSLSPFYIQNLSYQFDGLPMMLSIFLAILPFYISRKNINDISKIIISSLLLVLSISLYQSSINIFISVVAIETVLYISKKEDIKLCIMSPIKRVLSLLISLLIYYLIVIPFISSSLSTRPVNNIEMLAKNIKKASSILQSINTTPFYIAWFIPITLAFIGTFIFLNKIVKSNNSFRNKFLLITLFFACIIVSLFSVFGPFIFLNNAIIAPRIMMGFSGVILMIFLLCTFVKIKNINYLISILPIMLSISLSSSYGNASKMQRMYENMIIFDIYNKIPSEWKNQDIYVYGSFPMVNAAKAETNRFPLLKWIVIPLYDWSAMLMLRHYDLPVKIDAPETEKYYIGEKIYKGKNFELIQGDRNIIKIK